MNSHLPSLPGDVHIARSADQLYDDLAVSFMTAAIEAVGTRGEFHVALSGGSTPEPFYMRLVTDPTYRHIPWEKTHLWIVDERRVPESDERSNYRMIRETLADHLPLRSRQCHPMPVLEDDPVQLYERELRQVVDPNTPAGQPPRLDMVLLGMGDDAHTASLFPHSPALSERSRLVAVNAGPTVTPPDRVTMTYPLINAARRIAILVTGTKKADTLRRIDIQMQTIGPNPSELPITGVKPDPRANPAGTMTWYLDYPAAGKDELMPE